ncbi:hypothetical protein C8R47DRAFT_1268380 [Mycena vitilis]|nr:hypothetical protein C8R47DRAFT_1268380 [Mycena vitilis]
MTSRKVSGSIISQQEDKILKKQLAVRENYYCAITGKFSMDRIKFLQRSGRANEVPHPRSGYAKMKVVRILPLALIDFKDGGQNLETMPASNAAIMRRNDLLLEHSLHKHRRLNTRQFYLKEQPAPHAYEATSLRGCFIHNVTAPTVVFSGTDLPNPEYIAIHAAFAQVLHAGGVVAYVQKLRCKKGKVEGDEEADEGQYKFNPWEILSLAANE